MKIGTPVPLDDGTWGARVDSDEAPEIGERITITGRSGTWTATITHVDSGYRGVYLCRVKR
jgi:hypothetical protein